MNTEPIPDLIPEDPPRWTVATYNPGTKAEYHALLYGEREISTLKGPRGLDQLRDQASLFNRKGSVPRDEPGPATGAADDTAPLVFDETTNPDPMKPQPKSAILAKASTLALPELHPATAFQRYPQNRTVKAEHIKTLAESIKEVGILNAVLARPLPDALKKDNPGITLQIIAGEGRWLAATSIDAGYLVPVTIKELSDKEAAKIHAVENFQREDLDEIEEAQAIKHMRDTGWTTEEIIESLGRSQAHIYRRLDLLKLTAEAQQSLRDKNISINTAHKIITLPAYRQDEALKAVVSPTHSKDALSEREALSLLERNYVEPMKKALAWSDRRKLVEKENPGTKWLPYEQAVKAHESSSQLVRASHTAYHTHLTMLSDPARASELVVPTWEVLAKRHGGEILIGLPYYGDDVVLYVDPLPLIEAEKSACDRKPEDCIFVHPKLVQKAKDAAARKKMEEEKRKADEEKRRNEFDAERQRLIDCIFNPAALAKTKEKKFTEAIGLYLFENGHIGGDSDDFTRVFGVKVDGRADQEVSNEFESRIQKHFRDKSFTGFEALGRLVAADLLASVYSDRCVARFAFKDECFKRADFPRVADLMAEMEKEEEDQKAVVAEVTEAVV